MEIEEEEGVSPLKESSPVVERITLSTLNDKMKISDPRVQVTVAVGISYESLCLFSLC